MVLTRHQVLGIALDLALSSFARLSPSTYARTRSLVPWSVMVRASLSTSLSSPD